MVVIGVSLSQIANLGDDDGGGSVTADTQAAGDAAATSAQETADDAATGLERELSPATEAEDDALGNAASPQEAEGYGLSEVGRDSRSALVEPNGAVSGLSGALDRSGANRAQDKRQVERDAQLTLAAPADEVADVNDQVIDVVEGAKGVVLNSRVTGTDESARATLEVEVPSSTLGETLAALSELANVRSRTEQSQDITRVYVSARDRLVGLRATRDNLATRIREATTDAELAALQAQLAGVNRQIADAKSELSGVQKRARLASVTIVITSEGAGTSEDEDDGWSFGDALGDAGKVLEVGAGVALISAAVLLPLAIIAAIAYFVVAAANRRSRERALDE